MSWLPSRLRGDRDIPMWIALGIAFLLAIQPDDGALRLVVVGILAIVIVISRWWRLGWTGIAILLVAGLLLRLGVANHRASDVLDVTSAAIRQVLDGLNPWGHGYAESRPPGAPLPYGPLELLWYLPNVGDPRSIELFVSCGILAAFAVRGRPVGLAVYAMAPTIVLTSSDGSNDTSAGLLILIALVTAGKRPWVGAVFLALAFAFKPYAAAWVPALMVYGGLPALVAFVATSAAVWAGPAVYWGIDNWFTSLRLADETHFTTYWSLGVIWEEVTRYPAPKALLDSARLVLALLATVAGMFVAKSIDRVIVIGVIVFVIVMFGGYWGSYAYFGAIAPIVCWRLDDWLGVPAPSFLARMPWVAPATAAAPADRARAPRLAGPEPNEAPAQS